MANLLNGKNFNLFGLIIPHNGSDSFLLFPARKQSLSYDFPDESGIDIDLTTPQFSAREFTLKLSMVANNRADFWTKYNGLFTELSLPGTTTIYLDDADKSFLVYYKSMSDITKLSVLNSSGQVGCSFDLVFGEADPRSNIDVVYLDADLNDYLIE
ncbi:MAG: hypothetical protein ABIN91_11295 [Mucilaginibacter sp.]|uniref:hypothetical protein n=1 Tax=Mucilaginibacter sp. TaxID=1882438 RepID=UPI0032667A27